MIFWIKQENYGDAIRLEDISWRYSVYLAADDKSDLNSILREENIAWPAAGVLVISFYLPPDFVSAAKTFASKFIANYDFALVAVVVLVL